MVFECKSSRYDLDSTQILNAHQIRNLLSHSESSVLSVSISSSPMMPSLITLDTWRPSSYLLLFVRLSLFSSLLSSTRVCLWFLSRPVRLCSNWTLGVQSATKGDRLSIALRERPVTPIRNGETIRRKNSAASGLGNGRGCSRRGLSLRRGQDERTRDRLDCVWRTRISMK